MGTRSGKITRTDGRHTLAISQLGFTWDRLPLFSPNRDEKEEMGNVSVPVLVPVPDLAIWALEVRKLPGYLSTWKGEGLSTLATSHEGNSILENPSNLSH